MTIKITVTASIPKTLGELRAITTRVDAEDLSDETELDLIPQSGNRIEL